MTENERVLHTMEISYLKMLESGVPRKVLQTPAE